MKTRLIALAALALFGLNLSPAWAGKLEQIKKDGLRVCLEPAYMPFEMTDKRGQIIGFDRATAQPTVTLGSAGSGPGQLLSPSAIARE